jgi:hypothetical protein
MRRSGFKRPARPKRQPLTLVASTVRSAMGPRVAAVVSAPKDAPIRDEAYRRYVAALPCLLCGVVGYSQAAHADRGKGLGMKACDTTCYPLCGTRTGEPGCHWLVGTSGRVPRERRREIEERGGRETQLTLIAMSASDKKLAMVLVRVKLLPAEGS